MFHICICIDKPTDNVENAACMRTLWLPMCSTVAPMARGGRRDITSNAPGQSFTSTRALLPIFRMSTVLRWVPSAVPPKAVGACDRHPPFENRLCGSMFQVEKHTQCTCMSLSVPFNFEQESVAHSHMVEAFSVVRRPSAAPPSAAVGAPETP